MKLCTAEKRNVAADIARVIGADAEKDGYFEGNGYLVTWALGHLVELAEPEKYGYVPQTQMYKPAESKQKAYDELPIIPENFKLCVIAKEKSEKQFKIIKTLMERPDVELIIDCGDMGAEGHILQWLIREKAGCRKPVKRFCATSMTDEAIRAAMDNLQPIEKYANIIKGEFCKKKADWIMGLSLSRCASIKYNAVINIGRVMSPTLYFIVKRYWDVNSFRVTDYYGLTAKTADGFNLYWNKDTDNIFPKEVKDDDGRLLNADSLKSKISDLNAPFTASVTELSVKKKQTNRPQLFDITELQRVCNRKFGYSAALTLAAAQSLYETHKVLSYPRTDSRYITSDLVRYMPARIENISSVPEYKDSCAALLSAGLNIDSKIADDTKVTDHHALIITNKINGLDFALLNPTKNEITEQGLSKEILSNVLHTVLTRMIIAFCKPYIYEKTDVTVTLPNNMKLKATGSRPIDMGFKEFENKLSFGKEEQDTDTDEEQAQQLPKLQEGQAITISALAIAPKKTTPPLLHTEATLLTAMESAGATVENGKILYGRGIGTQATRADTIKKLFKYAYIENLKKGKTNYLMPTAIGIEIVKILPNELLTAKISADWEEKIALIADNKMSDTEFMTDFTGFIRNTVRAIKENNQEANFKKPKEVYGQCPWCGGNINRHTKKDTQNKVISDTYYCADKCNYFFNTMDKDFIRKTGKILSDANAAKLAKEHKVKLKCKKADGDENYDAVVTVTKDEKSDGGKVYPRLVFQIVYGGNKKKSSR